MSGELDVRSKALIESVWDTYKGYDAVQLSMLTHEIGGAWDLTMKANMDNFGSPIIPNELIKIEFERRRQQQA